MLTSDTNCQVGIITNNWRGFDVRKLFPANVELDVVVESYVVKLRKPDPAIYEYAFNVLKQKDRSLRMSEICFCDDLDMNVKAARKLGWTGLRVVPGKEQVVLDELNRLKTINRAKL
jgi:putative hydrolase of the HAD superfamily